MHASVAIFAQRLLVPDFPASRARVTGKLLSKEERVLKVPLTREAGLSGNCGSRRPRVAGFLLKEKNDG
jgi:hypothetical protein